VVLENYSRQSSTLTYGTPSTYLLTILAERQAAPYLYLDIQQEARQSYGSETIEVVWGCGCGNRAYHFYVSNT
jgi:hypothetical protein